MKKTLNEQLSRIKGMMQINESMKRSRTFFNNGGSVSIQASSTHYCEPRNDKGPYWEVEVGYPSEGTELPEELLDYEESRVKGFDPYKSIYAYVPTSVIKKMIEMNGGVRGDSDLPPMTEPPSKSELSKYDNERYGPDENDPIYMVGQFEEKLSELINLGERLSKVVPKNYGNIVPDMVNSLRALRGDEEFEHYEDWPVSKLKKSLNGENW